MLYTGTCDIVSTKTMKSSSVTDKRYHEGHWTPTATFLCLCVPENIQKCRCLWSCYHKNNIFNIIFRVVSL